MKTGKGLRSSKNLLNDPGYQGRILFFIFLVGIVGGIFNGYLYYHYVDESYDFILKYSTLSPEMIAERHGDLLLLGIVLGIATLLITLVIAGWALVITHRSAGAIFHMKRVIREIIAGNVSARVRLREKDEFQELAQSFNQMMDNLQKK